MSKVSIVVPIFNAGKKLNKCISSILNQTFTEFELILVNDGSTDDSLNICRKYEKLDNRILVINKKNEGSIKTRKRGIEACSSLYVMFVDADDWINENTVETLYNETINNNADVTVCNISKVIGNFKRKNKSTYFQENKLFTGNEIKDNLVEAYFHGHPFPPSLCAKLYKKDLLVSSGNFLEGIHFLGDDLFYNLEILLKAKRVRLINKSLYYYRLGGFTSKYMPYLFSDMVKGYTIQKEVINQYFNNNKQKNYNGISIMLLNTLKTCLANLFYSNLSQNEIKEQIKKYVSNAIVLETIESPGAIKYFPQEYLYAINDKNIEYLYILGKKMYNKSRPRGLFIGVLSRFI